MRLNEMPSIVFGSAPRIQQPRLTVVGLGALGALRRNFGPQQCVSRGLEGGSQEAWAQAGVRGKIGEVEFQTPQHMSLNTINAMRLISKYVLYSKRVPPKAPDVRLQHLTKGDSDQRHAVPPNPRRWPTSAQP